MGEREEMDGRMEGREGGSFLKIGKEAILHILVKHLLM